VIDHQSSAEGAGPRVIAARRLAALTALALSLGLAACGGDGDSGSTAVQTGGEKSPAATAETGDSAKGGKAGAKSESTPATQPGHEDSGGGAARFEAVAKAKGQSTLSFGEEASGGEFEEIAAVLHAYLDARATGAWEAACGYLSELVVASIENLAAQVGQIKSGECAGILAELARPANEKRARAEASSADVGSVRIEGERAFVIYTGAGGAALVMPMRSEGGAWRLSDLKGMPLE